VPRLIRFDGVVKDAEGKVMSGTTQLTFSLYQFPEGGTPLWSETQSVTADELGHYTALLGTESPGGVPLDLFSNGQARWLGVQAQLPAVGELPRVLLVGVPYALKAADADTLGGKPASAYVLAGSSGGTASAGESPTVIAATASAAGSSSPSATAQPGGQAGTAGSASTQPLVACSMVTSDGTATANYLAKFTAACNVEKSLLFDTGTSVGVGTNAPGAFLDAQSTITATSSGFNYGLRALTTANPAATSSASIFSLFAMAQTPTGNAQNITGNLYGMDGRVDHYGTGTLNGAYGGFGAVLNHAAGTITNGYGLWVGAPLNTGGGKFSNYTGVYIASPSGVVPGAFGLYSAGGKNYFGGNVGIGTPSPAAALEVNGTAQFDKPVTFASGQVFPGTGTITGVTAGAGLSGGGASGNVPLAVQTCPSGQFLQSTGSGWTCASVGGGGGPILGVTAGTDLTGGGSTPVASSLAKRPLTLRRPVLLWL
jgi:hypothetical protein